MMNMDRFIDKRKQMGLSQNELADGICTQATLSRFENNGQVPNLKILMKLCTKLNLSLAELFPKVGVKHTETIEKMNKVEFFLITSEYTQASDLLQSIPVSEIEDPLLLLRYRYLEGFIMLFQNEATMDTLFVFNQILFEEESKDSTIFRLLAYTGIGMIYFREKESKKAEFYFSRILESIYTYPTQSVEDTWRVLHIVFQCSVFYAEMKELDVSNALAHYAVTICSDNHVTYYLARAAIQLAKNAMAQKKPKEKILELIYDARAYSKINRNTIALKELEGMEKEVK